MTEEVVEEPAAPLGRRRGPGDLEAAGDGVGPLAGAVGALPAEALALERGGLGLGTDVVTRPGAVGLAEGVAAGDQGDRLLVVHGHPPEGLADVAGRRDRVRLPVGALRVDVDQAHLHRAQGGRELAVAAVALVAEPAVLRAPEDLLGLPDVLATEAEAEGLEAHRLERDVAGVHQQVGPRDLAAVLLLDRPQQPARLVEVGVVGPAVQGGEALAPVAGAAAAVLDAVGAGGVPAQADHQAAVVAEVGRPPVLRGRHHREHVLPQSLDVEAAERRAVVEVGAHRVALGRVLVEDLQVELVGPPVLVGVGAACLGLGRVDDRVLALGHVGPSFSWFLVGVSMGVRRSGGRAPSR